jgi:hypothetical protein
MPARGTVPRPSFTLHRLRASRPHTQKKQSNGTKGSLVSEIETEFNSAIATARQALELKTASRTNAAQTMRKIIWFLP